MKIRWKIDISGTVYGRADGVRRGDVMDVDDATGAELCRAGRAEPVVDRKEERAVAPAAEERAGRHELASDEQESKPQPKPRRGPRASNE